MAHLSDLQLATLLDEIAAAMQVGAPISDAMRRLGERRLGKVAKVARGLAADLERGVSVPEAMRVSSSPMMGQAAAAVEVCQTSKDPSLVHQVADQLRSRYEHSRLTRLTWLYPIFVAGVAYAVAVLVMAPVVRDNQARGMMRWSDNVVRISHYLETSWPIPLMIGVFVVVLFLLWISRRNQIPKTVQGQLFCQSLADQLEHGVADDVAIGSAASMAGLSNLANEPNPSLDSPKIRKWMRHLDLQIPEMEGAAKQEILIARLRYASAVYNEESRRNDYLWGRLLPRVAMVIIGGGLTLAYAWWVIRPVYQQVIAW